MIEAIFAFIQKKEAILLKTISFICFLFVSLAFASNNENANAFSKYMSPEGGINPSSGTVALQKDIASLSVGQVSVNFTLKYSGNIFKEVSKSNDKVPGGIVGLGWSLGRSKIVCDCKDNAFLNDDIYYLIMADGNRYKIFEEKAWRKQFNVDYDEKAQERWWVEGNPFWKVTRETGETVLLNNGGHVWKYVKGWKITDSEGVAHFYGDLTETKTLTSPTPNATEYDLAWLRNGDKDAYGLMETAFSGTPSYYPVAWNISKEEALDGNSLVYKYEQHLEKLSGQLPLYKDGKNTKYRWNSEIGYTKETYLKSVSASNNARIDFEYEEKGLDKFKGEYLDKKDVDENLSDAGSDMFREKNSRKFLSKIEIYGPSEEKEGDYLGKVSFCYSPLQEGNYVKRLLSAVHFFNKKGKETDFEEYSYYTNVSESKSSYTETVAYPLGALYKLRGKDCGWVEFSYVYEPLGNGHVEELPLDSIYGRSFLENGTAYLVGKKNGYLKIYTRVLGRWVLTDLTEKKDGKDVPVPAADSVSLGDAGWFMAVNGKKVDSGKKGWARIFQWNGREWQKVFVKEFNIVQFVNNTINHSMGVQVESAHIGPDYALVYKIAPGATSFSVEVFWTKWGETPNTSKEINLDGKKVKNVFLYPRKNHILLQYYDDSQSWGNELRYAIYTFRDGKLEETFSGTEIDSDNHAYLNGSYFADVGEGLRWNSASRVIIRGWSGSGWIPQYLYRFSNSDPADVQSYGSDYFAVRYNENRHLRIFALEKNMWNGGALHDKLFNHQMSSGFYWQGVGTEDFFVTTRSYRRKWYHHVQENKRIKLYYHKNDNKWTSYDYGRLSGFEGDVKKIIVGSDWFLEKNASKLAWVWNGSWWKTEDLSGANYLKGAKVENIYSLGGDMLAASANGKTKIIYKVTDSFIDGFGTYLVRNKKVCEPVTDKISEYEYSYLTGKNSVNSVAYDDASNTPLMDVMKVTVPGPLGIIERHLCEIVDGSESVAVGAVCYEKQIAKDGVGIISQTKTYYSRTRENWPYPVYLDQEKTKVEIARGIKTVIRNEYSKNNGGLKKTTKRIGNNSTEQNYVFLVDLENLSNDEKIIVNKIVDENRMNIVAGAYSCIPNCTNGAIVMANANGLTSNDDLMMVSSSWKYTPKKKLTEGSLKNHIKSIALHSQIDNNNWERQSFNSRYHNKHVVETQEGPRNIKVASFYENSELGKMYGSAANCGINEGLMLSGESCNIANWSGCNLDSLGGGSAKDALVLNRNDYEHFGRFSKRYIKLTSVSPLIGTIPNAKNDEYTFSAWMPYASVNANLVLSVNGAVKKIWETRPSSLPADSIGRWTRIEWSGKLNGLTNITLSLQNSASFVPLQDIRVLPSNATSTTSYWNHEWNKVETTVNTKGVASYVSFDDLGRETEHYSETEQGDVYLASRTTYVDGICSANPKGSGKLASLFLNERAQKLPDDDVGRNATYTLSASRVYVDFTTVDPRDGLTYRLYAQGETPPNQWISPDCGPLCYPSFSFSEDKMAWVLEVDVIPDERGVYTFILKKRENDWIEYGPFDGFAKGEVPRYIDDFDSSYVAFKNDEGLLNFSEYNGNKWVPKSEMVFDYVAEFDVFSKAGQSYLAYVSEYGTDDAAYPKVLKVTNDGVEPKDVSDKSIQGENVKIVVNSAGNPAMLFTKASSLVEKQNPADPTEKDNVYVYDGSLSAMEWNSSRATFEYLGASPVFEYNNAVVDKNAKRVTFNTGKITSYLPGIVNEYDATSSDIAYCPDGKLYVAYVSTSKFFDWCEQKKNGLEDDCASDAPFVYVKRLYKSSELTNVSKNIWAGVSRINGVPLYQGDILSWSDNPYDAIEGVEKIMLECDDNSNLYLAVSYEIPEDYVDEEISSSSSQETSSSSSTGSLLLPTHVLSVFKGTIANNVLVDGKNYSSFLKWEPLKDLSIPGTYMAKSLDEERLRIAYMDENDDFDFAVRGGIPYVMFRNKDNRDAISVISFRGNKWLSVGNPGFAYPSVAKGSVDLGVNNNGNPFVVLKTNNSKENNGKENKIVAMHYNPENALDLSLSNFESTDADFNSSCSFRQYILHYIANLGVVDNFAFKATPSAIGKVKELLVVINGNNPITVTDFSKFTLVPLNKGLNKLEVRVVGHDGSTLSYDFDLYRKILPDPNFYTVGLMASTVAQIDSEGKMVIDVVPKNVTEKGTVVLDIHFTTGWVLVLEINGVKKKFDVATTIELPIDQLPISGEFVYEKDNTVVPVIIINRKEVITDPTIVPWYEMSSSSGNENSSSSYSSSSESILNVDMSINVPDEIRNLTVSRLFASYDMDLADNVSVKGDVLAGRNFIIGVTSVVEGNVYSGQDVLLRNRADVGNIYYVNNFEVQDGATYKSRTQWSRPRIPVIPTFTFDIGNSDVLVNPGASRSVVAGLYGDFIARAGTTVNFSAGDYYFRDFYTDSQAKLNFSPGTRLWIGGNLRIGNDNELLHSGKTGDLFVYVRKNVTIETNVKLKAVLVAPDAFVSVSSRTHIFGYIFTKNLNIQPNVIVE